MSGCDFSLLKGRRVLVTGSTGFKGSWLCSWLLRLGADVSGFALPPEPDAPLFDQLRLPTRMHQFTGDIRDGAAVHRVFAESRPEVVIHLAAQALVFRGYASAKTTFDTNVGGAVNLLEAVRVTEGVRSLVFITSDKCYRNNEWAWGYRENDRLGGSDPYSASKAAAELVFAAYAESFFAGKPGLLAATARAGNVVGGGDLSQNRIVPDCIRALGAHQAIVLRRPASTRPWQHVLEPLSGYLTLACRQLEGDAVAQGSWNFGPDAVNVRTAEDLARAVAHRWGRGEVLIDPGSSDLHEAGLLMLNNDKAKILLGWRPRWNFAELVDHTVEWYWRIGEGENPVSLTEAQIAAYDRLAP